MVSHRGPHGRAGLLAGVLAAGPLAAAALPDAPPPAVPADRHLQAARDEARHDPALRQTVQRACARSAAPATAALAEQALRQAEGAYQHERAQARPDAGRLLRTVLQRSCAAYHATRLQPGVSYPVWRYTRLTIEAIRPAATGFTVQARASSAEGSVASSRITFSRGLHHACFVSTDASGQAACVMVDTHPHGGLSTAWAEAHEGPLVATYAGHVSATAVQLPAVETRDLPVFSR